MELNVLFFNIRLPDQPLMQLGPPAKKTRFSKSRVATTAKSVTKQSKNVNNLQSAGANSLQSAEASTSNSNIRVETQRIVSGTSRDNGENTNNDTATTSSSGLSQTHRGGVEKVTVGKPVYHSDLRGGQYIPQWDPYVMVETVSNVRLFPGHPMLDSETFVSPSVSGHSGVSSLRRSNVTTLEHQQTKGEVSQQSEKAKGKSGISYSGKEKGPQKSKMFITKGRRNNDGRLPAQGISNSSDMTKQAKSFSKSIKTASNSRGENSRQKHGEPSGAHSSHRTWPTIPNLDYPSGKRYQVTYNNKTVFITQYKLLK